MSSYDRLSALDNSFLLFEKPNAYTQVASTQISDQERGVQHHIAVLLSYLMASARREFESAMLRVASRLAVEQERNRND